MSKTVRAFILRITLITSFVFAIHILVLSVLNFQIFSNKIVLAYTINTFLAIITFWALYQFRNTFKTQIGFLFIAGSIIKITCFFLFFNDYYRSDDKISSLEFFAFFTPYFITLIVEVFYISKWLNKMK